MKDRYIETHKTWNKISQLYEEKFMGVEIYNDTYKRFCDLLSTPDASVFEIGCGPGNITHHILDLNPKLKVLATDISDNMIDLAQKNNPSIKVQVLDCRKINTIKNKFDGVICGFTIPYLSKIDCLKLISDSTQLLNEGGILYLSFVAGEYKNSGFISGSSGDRTYFYYYDVKTIKQQLELNHMTVVDIIEKQYEKSDTISETHIIINAKRQNRWKKKPKN